MVSFSANYKYFFLAFIHFIGFSFAAFCICCIPSKSEQSLVEVCLFWLPSGTTGEKLVIWFPPSLTHGRQKEDKLFFGGG